MSPSVPLPPLPPALPSRRNRRRVARAGALALAGAAAVEARHLRALAADPEHKRLSRPMRGEVSRTVSSSDGTSLHTETFGPDSGPTIVLIPGWTELLTIFDLMTRRLIERGFRVVAYDLRGQGMSGQAPHHDHALARYGEDVEAVLAATCDGRDDIVVAGHSLGAMSIAAWAAAHDVSARVRAAALLNTGLDGVISNSGVVPAIVPAAVQLWLGREFLASPLPVPPVSTALSRAAIRYAAFGPHATRAHVAFFERMLVSCALPVRAAAGVAMADMDLTRDLQRLTVPTLVVSGEVDRLTPASHGRRIAEALPDLHRLLLLPEIGHMAPLECPDVLCRALAELAEAVGIAPTAEASASH